MTALAKQIIDQALQLDEDDRAEVAHEMLASLGGGDIDPAMAQVINRRGAEIEAGTATTIPWPEIKAELEDLLRRGR